MGNVRIEHHSMYHSNEHRHSMDLNCRNFLGLSVPFHDNPHNSQSIASNDLFQLFVLQLPAAKVSPTQANLESPSTWYLWNEYIYGIPKWCSLIKPVQSSLTARNWICLKTNHHNRHAKLVYRHVVVYHGFCLLVNQYIFHLPIDTNFVYHVFYSFLQCDSNGCKNII